MPVPLGLQLGKALGEALVKMWEEEEREEGEGEGELCLGLSLSEAGRTISSMPCLSVVISHPEV